MGGSKGQPAEPRARPARSAAHLGGVGDDRGVQVDAVEAQLAVAIDADQLRDHADRRHQRPQDDVAQHALGRGRWAGSARQDAAAEVSGAHSLDR